MWTRPHLDLKWGVAIHWTAWQPKQSDNLDLLVFLEFQTFNCRLFLSLFFSICFLFLFLLPSLFSKSHVRAFQGSLQLAFDQGPLACNYKNSEKSYGARLEVCMNMQMCGQKEDQWRGLYFSQMTQLSVKTTARHGPKNISAISFIALTPSFDQTG